jgi:hypothetical protein
MVDDFRALFANELLRWHFYVQFFLSPLYFGIRDKSISWVLEAKGQLYTEHLLFSAR